jgi:hypothetical protein
MPTVDMFDENGQFVSKRSREKQDEDTDEEKKD